MNKCPSHLLCYVYQLVLPSGDPFYIGFGTVGPKRPVGYRARQHLQEARDYRDNGILKKGANLHKINTILQVEARGEEVGVEIISSAMSREDATALEKDLIKEIGRRDLGEGDLTNLTDGGEGGANLSPESNSRRSQKLKGRTFSEESRRKMSQVRKGRIITPEWRAKISAYQKGREHSAEWNRKVGEATRRNWTDENYRRKMKQSLSRVWKVTFPDGHEEIRLGLADLIVEQPQLRLPGLSKASTTGKPYKGFYIERVGAVHEPDDT